VFIDIVIALASRSNYSRSMLIIATDHIDLLKGKLEKDNDALNDNAKSPNTEKSEKDADDDLAFMMSGLGIETKCSICFVMYPHNISGINIIELPMVEKDVVTAKKT